VQTEPVRAAEFVRGFLDAYVPVDQLATRLAAHPQSFRERLKALCDSRSKITHGSDLVGRDGLAGGLIPSANTEESDCARCCASRHLRRERG
jgi:hypothetical protein